MGCGSSSQAGDIEANLPGEFCQNIDDYSPHSVEAEKICVETEREEISLTCVVCSPDISVSQKEDTLYPTSKYADFSETKASEIEAMTPDNDLGKTYSDEVVEKQACATEMAEHETPVSNVAQEEEMHVPVEYEEEMHVPEEYDEEGIGADYIDYTDMLDAYESMMSDEDMVESLMLDLADIKKEQTTKQVATNIEKKAIEDGATEEIIDAHRAMKNELSILFVNK